MNRHTADLTECFMKCLIFSDSHRQGLSLMERALSLHPDAEAVFFLGDGLSDLTELRDPRRTLFFVRGNCDFFVDTVGETEEVTLLGHKILYTHGHRYGAKGGEDALLALAIERGADLLLYGHTHKQSERSYSFGETRCILFNPGSAAEGDFGLLTLTEKDILFSHGHL